MLGLTGTPPAPHTYGNPTQDSQRQRRRCLHAIWTQDETEGGVRDVRSCMISPVARCIQRGHSAAVRCTDPAWATGNSYPISNFPISELCL